MRRHFQADPSRLARTPFATRRYNQAGAYEGPDCGDGLFDEVFLGALNFDPEVEHTLCDLIEGGDRFFE